MRIAIRSCSEAETKLGIQLVFAQRRFIPALFEEHIDRTFAEQPHADVDEKEIILAEFADVRRCRFLQKERQPARVAARKRSWEARPRRQSRCCSMKSLNPLSLKKDSKSAAKSHSRIPGRAILRM